MMIGFLSCFVALSALSKVDAWHAKFFPHSRRVSIQHFTSQPRGISPLQSKFNIPTVRAVIPLKFKVSESDEETEVDDEVIEFDDMGSSPMLKKLSKGMPIVAASLGFAITPSSAIALRIAGAAAGGLAGFMVKNMVLEKLKLAEVDGGDNNGGGGGGSAVAVSPAVLLALETIKMGPPVTSMGLKKLEQIARKCKVSDEELGEFFSQVFSEVVIDAVLEDGADLTELSDIIDFAETVGLSPSEVGDGFSIAAGRLGSQLAKDERGFFVSKRPKGMLLQASKMFFLADKMLGVSDGFYGKRLAVSLSFFTNEEFKNVITEACTDLFKRCIEGVITSPDDFTPETVSTLKDFLDTTSSVSELRPASMQNMILEALQLTLNNALDGSTALEAEIANYPELLKAQSILGWSPIEFDATLETRIMPVFEDAARQIVREVTEHPETAVEMAELLQERIKSLNVDLKKARVYLTTLVSEQNAVYMNEIDRVYNASGGAVEPAFKIMAAYTDTHAALRTLTDSIMDGVSLPVPGLPFAEMVRVSMFKMNIGKARGLSERMFQLNPEQQRIVRKNLALPKITGWINQCIAEGNFDENAKNAYTKLLLEYEISDEEWQSTSVDFYYQDVQRIAKSRAVPSNVDMARLDSLKKFLGCNDVSVAKVNMELLGDKYVKAVTESMMPTGVITEEYLDGLDRLRLRLGLTVEDATNLLGVAARMRITPVVKDLVSMWKADTGMAKREDKDKASRKDKSGDMISSQDNVFGYMETGAQKEGGGPNVFMREALNLVDFFVSNYVTQDVDLSTLESMPVTAVGVVPEKELTGMLKHYLITRLSEQDEDLRARYIANEKLFALVLGIVPEGQAKVKESLSYTAYKNMLKNILRVKDSVEPQDVQQFVILKDSLELDQATADKVLIEASRGAVVEHAASFLRPKGGTITAAMAMRFRKQVLSLGLSMQRDTGFNEKLVTYLYALEVQQLVESGEEESLGEVQEAYDIPQERAEQIVEASCKRFVSQLLNLSLRAAKKYDERETVTWTRQIAKYAVFISGAVDADGNLFKEEDKKRMISFFEASLRDEAQRSKEPMDAEICDKLRSMINLTPEFKAPIDGIDGLLGKVKGMSSVGGGDDDDDRKKWAWG